jgi:hypothetical protein
MENQSETTNEQQTTAPVLTEQKIFEYREKIKLEQNLIMGIAGGSIAALAGAVLWALITVSIERQIGYMAVGVGFLVGFSVRYFGKGVDPIFGIMGAAFALLGCVLGNFFSLVGFAAPAEGMGYFEMLGAIDYSLVPEIMADAFHPMDVLFYGIAIYEGYKFSFRQITEEEVINS